MKSYLLLASALLVAGCVTPNAPAAELDAAATQTAAEDLERIVQELAGHATASALAPLAHRDAQTERLVAPIQREGFILEIAEVPTMLQIEIEWDGTVGGEMFPMVNVPAGAEGKVVDYLGEWSDTGLACMRLPVAELLPDRISLMAHSRGAVDIDFTVRVTTVGGATTLLDAPHMEVERSDPTEGEALPCEDEAEAEA